MIDRYSTKDMKRIWSDQNKFQTWEKVEIAVAEVMKDKGIVPEKSFEVIKSKSKFDVERILEIEKTTRHDVIAFLTNLSENIGPDARFLHLGMTSSENKSTWGTLCAQRRGIECLSGQQNTERRRTHSNHK